MSAVEGADDLGTYTVLALGDGSGSYHVRIDQWDEIDAAYHHWTERRIDKVMDLTMEDGDRLLIAVSRIAEIELSTPAGRERQNSRRAAMKAEEGFSE